MRTSLLIVAVAGLPLVLFSFTLSLPFMCDDFFFIQELSGESYSAHPKKVNLYELIDPDTTKRYPYVVPWWTSPDAALRFFRPLSSLSLRLDYLIWHKNPFGYHLTNLILHSLSCVVVGMLGRRLIKSTRGAFLAALLFTSNPAISFVVAWIADRISLLVVLFSLIGLWAHIRFRDTEKPRWGALAWVFFVLALLSRESGASSFAAYVLYDILVWRKTHPEKWPGLLQAGKYYTPFCGAVLGFVLYYVSADYGVSGYYAIFDETKTLGAAVLAVTRNVLYYASGLLFLVPFPSHQTFGQNDRHFSMLVMVALFMAVCTCVIFYPLIRKRLMRQPLFLFLGCWTIVCLLPILPLVPQARHLYVPAAPFALFIATYLVRLIHVRGFGKLSIPIVFFLMVLWVVVPVIGVVLKRDSFHTVFGFQTRIVRETSRQLEDVESPVNVVFINLPSEAYVLALQHAFDVMTSKGRFRTYPLTVSKDVPELEVLGPSSVRIRTLTQPFLQSALERLFMTDSLAYPGRSRSNGFLTATIEDVRGGRIYSIRFDFSVPLNDTQTTFFYITHDYPRRFSFQ